MGSRGESNGDNASGEEEDEGLADGFLKSEANDFLGGGLIS